MGTVSAMNEPVILVEVEFHSMEKKFHRMEEKFHCDPYAHAGEVAVGRKHGVDPRGPDEVCAFGSGGVGPAVLIF